MGKKCLILLNFLTFLLIYPVLISVISCESAPNPVNIEEREPVTASPEPAPEVIVEPVSDPAVISYEYYLSTKEEVQQFIDNLNTIIKDKDFKSWEGFLSPDYIEAVSSPMNLNWISDTEIMRRGNIRLKDLRDYFTYVVIPARSSDRIQADKVDIEFINENRVTVYAHRTSNTGDDVSEILYDLEKINNLWKIIY